VLDALNPNARRIVLASLLGIKYSLLSADDKVQISLAQTKGCLQIDNDYIVLPYNVFSVAIASYAIEFSLPLISHNLRWQDFEKIIAQYQALRCQFIGLRTLESVLPGAITATHWSDDLQIARSTLKKDEYWCVHNNNYTPNLNSDGGFNGQVPSGVFLCLTANPTFDIRISALDSTNKCHLIWEQLRHQEIEVKSSRYVTTDMITTWYNRARQITLNRSYFPYDPLLVYITNKEPNETLFLDQLVKKLPNLAVITRAQFPNFFPPALLPLVVDVNED